MLKVLGLAPLAGALGVAEAPPPPRRAPPAPPSPGIMVSFPRPTASSGGR